MIMKEVNASDTVQKLIENNDFKYLCDTLESGSIEKKIIKYSDLRVGPYGVLSYEDRMSEAAKRYTNYKDPMKETERLRLVGCGKEIEKQIFTHSHIKPEDITDQSVAANIESLRYFSL
jgi:hypothetical protein